MPTSPDLRKPDWHIELRQDNTSLGFMMADYMDNRNPRLFGLNPFPKTASKIMQGRSTLSDQNPPFTDVALSDFTGGRGSLHFDDDETKFFDSKRADTIHQSSRVILGPQVSYIDGIRDYERSIPGDIDWQPLISGGTTSVTTSFTASASYNVESVSVFLKRVGNPSGNVTVSLLDASDTELKSKSIGATTACDDFISEEVNFEFSSVQAITDGTTYKVKVEYSGSDKNYLEVGVDSSSDLFYCVLDDTDSFEFPLIEYKGATYGVTIPDDGSVSKFYILGDRGAADSNSGDKSKLNDATKSWTADQWVGDIVEVIGGPGAQEEQNWREITDNDGTSLTVSPDWNVAHTTSTQYVIHSDTAKLKQTLTARIHDARVVRDKIYFTFGYPGGSSDRYVRRYREYNDGGTWTEEISSETNSIGAEGILGIPTTAEDSAYPIHANLYTTSFDDTGKLTLNVFQVPYGFDDMYYAITTLLNNQRAWCDTTYANSTVTRKYFGSKIEVADGFTTGKCAHWKLASALDVSQAEAIAMYLKIEPAAGGNYDDDGDIQIILADSAANEDAYNISGTVDAEFNELITLTDPQAATADQTDITDVYINIANDEGAVDISIFGPLLLAGAVNQPYKVWDDFKPNEIPNNLEEYAGGEGEVTVRPWIFTHRSAYYLDSGNVEEIYIKELEELSDPRNCKGVTVNDVWLYFNIGETIQRYYQGQLESVGPDVGYGLPEDRRGIPVSLASYPDRVVAAIDAGDNRSSILAYNNLGWHEMYRAPNDGDRIRNVHVVSRSDSPDRIYFSEGSDVAYIPVSINPETEDGYEFHYEAVVESGRIYGGERGVENYFHSVELITEELDDDTTIEVDYMSDSDSSWTRMDVPFTESPKQKQVLTEDYDVSGSWLKLRFRLYTKSNTVTPVFSAATLETIERSEINFAYAVPVRLPSGFHQNLNGVTTKLTGESMWDKLREWVNGERPVTVRSVNEQLHGKVCTIEPVTNYRLIKKQLGVKDSEVKLFTINLIEMIT